MKIQKILVPVDYSECSGAALKYAAEFAAELDATLDVLHVWDRPAYVGDTVMVHVPGGATRSLIDMVRENAEKEMEDFILTAKLPPEIGLTKRLLSGNPAATILDELKHGRHELVIVGTHGRTGLRHTLLGSVAERLVQLSPVPVLTVPRLR